MASSPMSASSHMVPERRLPAVYPGPSERLGIHSTHLDAGQAADHGVEDVAVGDDDGVGLVDTSEACGTSTRCCSTPGVRKSSAITCRSAEVWDYGHQRVPLGMAGRAGLV